MFHVHGVSNLILLSDKAFSDKVNLKSLFSLKYSVLDKNLYKSLVTHNCYNDVAFLQINIPSYDR